MSQSRLHLAVIENNPRLLASLIVPGQDIDTRDSDNQSALHYAAQSGAIGCLRILIDNGATIDARDRLRRTPLYLATGAAHNAAEMIMMLRGAGADAFARTASGSTPYDLATLWKDEIAECFSDLSVRREGGRVVTDVPNIACYATRFLVDEARRVGVMHRDHEGTWSFATATESQADVDNPEMSAIYSLQTIVTMDPSVIGYLRSDTGTTLLRRPDGQFSPQ